MNTQAHTTDYKVALDIGTTKVVAVAGRLDEAGKIEVLGYSKIYNTSEEQGEIFNMLQTVDQIKYVMQDLEKKYNITTDRVSIGLSGDHIRIMTLTDYIMLPENGIFEQKHLDDLKEKIRKSVVTHDDEEVLEIIPQTYLINGMHYTKNPIGVMGKRLEGQYRVVVGNSKKIELLRESLKEADLEAEKIYLQSIASATAVLKKSQAEAGSIIIDIGGGTTDLLIVNQGVIRHVGVVPWGGDYLTRQAAKAMNLPMPQAEQLKLLAGSALSQHIKPNTFVKLDDEDWGGRQINSKEFSMHLEKALDFITQNIRHQIENYETQFPREKLMGGIYLTGGGAHLKNILQYFEYKLQKKTFIGYPGIQLTNNQFMKELSKLMYSTVIGLLKLSLEENTEPAQAKEPQVKAEPVVPEETPEEQPETDLFAQAERKENKKKSKFDINNIWQSVQKTVINLK